MAFLGAVCAKPATNIATNSNTGINSSISNENENTNSSEIDTSDWLAYTNEEYELTFRYPSTWIIKQEWLETGLKGKKYNIFLQNQEKESILFFLTTKDFVAEEGEGDALYISGEPLIHTVEDLKKRGLPIYARYDEQAELETTYYIVPTYVGTSLGFLTLLENQEKRFPFLSINSPGLSYWKNLEVDSSEIDTAIKNFEGRNSPNQQSNDEYLALIKTIQY